MPLPDERPGTDNGSPGADQAPATPKTDTASLVREAISETEAADKALQPPDGTARPEAKQEPKPGQSPSEGSYLKNWKTQEEAVKGVTELERKLHEQAAELKALKEAKAAPTTEQPPATGTEPAADGEDEELSDEELAELAQTDPVTFAKYLRATTALAVEKAVKPYVEGKIKPFEEMKTKADQERHETGQREYSAKTKEIYGEDYPRLYKSLEDVETVAKLIDESPNGPQIKHYLQNNYGAQAIRLIFEAMELKELRAEKQARAKSTRSGPPRDTVPRKPDNPKASVREIVSDLVKEARDQ